DLADVAQAALPYEPRPRRVRVHVGVRGVRGVKEAADLLAGPIPEAGADHGAHRPTDGGAGGAAEGAARGAAYLAPIHVQGNEPRPRRRRDQRDLSDVAQAALLDEPRPRRHRD